MLPASLLATVDQYRTLRHMKRSQLLVAVARKYISAHTE